MLLNTILQELQQQNRCISQVNLKYMKDWFYSGKTFHWNAANDTTNQPSFQNCSIRSKVCLQVQHFSFERMMAL